MESFTEMLRGKRTIIRRSLFGNKNTAATIKEDEDDFDLATIEHIRSGLPISGFFGCYYGCPFSEFINLDQSTVLKFSLEFLGGYGITVLSSCNGILLCAHGRDNLLCASDNDIREFVVCDPSTRDLLAFPMPKGCSSDAEFCVALACPPTTGWTAITVEGLVALPNFRVVCLLLNFQEGTRWGRYEFEVYSSETREWRSVKMSSVDLAVKQGTHHYGGFYFRRSVHWIAKVGEDAIIVAFDVGRHTARKMQLPPLIGGSKHSTNIDWLGECNGFVHYIRLIEDRLEIWKMEDYMSVEWVLEHGDCLDFANCESSLKTMAELAVCEEEVWPISFDEKKVLLRTLGSNMIMSYEVETEKLELIHGGREGDELIQPWFIPYRMGLCKKDTCDSQEEEEWVFVS